MNNSINPADFSVGYNRDSGIVNNCEPPPPYSPSDLLDHNRPVIHQTIIVQAALKDSPVVYMCPHCQERVLTKVKYVSSKGTHMLAGFICGLTLWCMLCCLAALPYYFQTFKQTQHYCPNCDELLGTYSKV